MQYTFFVAKKWDHRQMTWSQERKLPPSRIIYSLRRIWKKLISCHLQKPQTANEDTTCCSHYHLLRTNFHISQLCHDQIVLQWSCRKEWMNWCWWVQSTLPVFTLICSGDDEVDSSPEGCLHQFEGLGTARIGCRVKFEPTVHDYWYIRYLKSLALAASSHNLFKLGLRS